MGGRCLGYWWNWGGRWNWGFGVGFCCLCKLFRKSEVVFRGIISEIRINIGFGCGFDDWGLRVGKTLWKSGNSVGICYGENWGKVVKVLFI